VRIVENHALPLVAVRVALESGSLLDPEGKDGLFTLDTLLIRDGTKSMTGDQLAQAIDELGSPVGPTRFTTVTGSFERSLTIMGEMLMHPTFPAEAIDRRKAAVVSGLQRSEGLSSTPALRIFNTMLYGSTHPFARRVTASTIAAITRDDLIGLHDRHVRPQNVTLTIVGDVSANTAMASIAKVFGDWQRTGERSSVSVPVAPAPKPTTIYLYDRPGSTQSTVVVGQVGPTRTTTDFYALEALGGLFGGPTGSRLTQALREGRPLTYAVSHLPVWRRLGDPSAIFGSSNVDAVKTDSALTVWTDELKAMTGARPPVQKELEFARSVTVGSLMTRIETIDEIANRLNIVANSDLPATYYDAYILGIEHVTTADLASVAKRYIDPSHTTIVVVGDRKVIEAPLRAANIAPLVIVDENGKPIL
jgi:zinc protease